MMNETDYYREALLVPTGTGEFVPYPAPDGRVWDDWTDLRDYLETQARRYGLELQEVFYGGDELTDGAEVILGLIHGGDPYRVYAMVAPTVGVQSYHGIVAVNEDDQE